MKQSMTDEQNFHAKEIEFAVFCIENVAKKLGVLGDEAYRMLGAESSILDDYIIKHYEVLHTQGKEYIVQDIIDYMKEQGIIR